MNVDWSLRMSRDQSRFLGCRVGFVRANHIFSFAFDSDQSTLCIDSSSPSPFKIFVNPATFAVNSHGGEKYKAISLLNGFRTKSAIKEQTSCKDNSTRVSSFSLFCSIHSNMNKRSPNVQNLSHPIVSALWEGKKIEAIKILRAEQDLGLKEAKDIIDEYIQHNPGLQEKFSFFQSENIRSMLFVILMILMLILTLYFL